MRTTTLVAMREGLTALRNARKANNRAKAAHNHKAKSQFYAKKNALVSRAVVLIPELIEVHDTRLIRTGIIGLMLPGAFGLHVPLANLRPDAREIVVRKLGQFNLTAA
jgi:hypothetical protein